jgi:hypothetical protein
MKSDQLTIFAILHELDNYWEKSKTWILIYFRREIRGMICHSSLWFVSFTEQFINEIHCEQKNLI